MEAKYETRKQELLDECEVAPQIFERVLRRLDAAIAIIKRRAEAST